MFQTEMQILAKSLEDPNYDPFSDDAQFMRLEAGIAGGVLGGAIEAEVQLSAPLYQAEVKH